MSKDGRKRTIVLSHNLETFDEGLTVIFCGKTLAEVIGEDEMCIDNAVTTTLGMLDDSNAPIVVSRVAILKVVGEEAGNVCTDIERLVADEHAHEETLSSEMFGRLKSAVTQKITVIVHEVGLTIDNGRIEATVLPVKSLYQSLYGIGGVQRVSSIQKNDVIAFCLGDGFVHSIIKATIFLADDADIMLRHGIALHVAANVREGAVSRTPVNNQVVDAGVCLLFNALQSAFQHLLSIICHSGYGDKRESFQNG